MTARRALGRWEAASTAPWRDDALWQVRPVHQDGAGYGSFTRSIPKEDALLIAAAPDLLAALEELDDCIGNGCSEERWDKACDKARNAIAKALGAA